MIIYAKSPLIKMLRSLLFKVAGFPRSRRISWVAGFPGSLPGNPATRKSCDGCTGYSSSASISFPRYFDSNESKKALGRRGSEESGLRGPRDQSTDQLMVSPAIAGVGGLAGYPVQSSRVVLINCVSFVASRYLRCLQLAGRITKGIYIYLLIILLFFVDASHPPLSD